MLTPNTKTSAIIAFVCKVCNFQKNCSNYCVASQRGNVTATRYVFEQGNTQKCAFGRGSAPDPTGGAYSTPSDPLVGF